MAIIGDEDVVGFDVAMDDALVVRRRETTDDLQSEIERLSLREHNSVHSLTQGLAFPQLGDYVGRRRVCRCDR